MPDSSFNPLCAARDLESAGIERQHAEAIANAINHGTERAATKVDLGSSIASVRAELVTVRWVVGIQVAFLLGVLTLVASIVLGAFDKFL